ncbi:unnamed protein product, partial [Adineta ricciae]
DEGQNGKVGYRKKGSVWPKWVDLVENRLVINCTNQTDSTCWNELLNEEVYIDVEAFDYGQPELSSVVKIRLYRNSARLMFMKYEYFIISMASLLGILFVLSMICTCICCRRKRTKKNIEIMDDNSTKQKIIQTSSSEQSSSAGSLYGSEKSDNITLETATSCHLDMFLFSPKRAATMTDSPYPYTFLNKSTNQADNLTNKLFHSIQNDLSLLTDSKQDVLANRGTYV